MNVMQADRTRIPTARHEGSRRRWRGRRPVGFAVALLTFVWSALVALTGAAPASAASTLNLNVGGGTASGVEGQDFYPGLVTIHTGDSINWNFRSFHTVNFYTDPTADPEGPPVGNGTFDGPNDPESSGILGPFPPGQNSYTLKFSTEGNYIYFCALHPGMQGMVQVLNSATATTQDQANQLGAAQLALDLQNGQNAVDAFQPTALDGPNGSTVFNIADGISDPQSVTSPVNPVAPNTTATGTAQTSFTFPSGQPTLHVVVTMSGMAPNTTSINHIHSGQCGVGSPPKGAANDILFTLTPLQVDASGNANATTDIPWDPNTMGPPALPVNSWYVNIHDPTTPSTAVACGNVQVHPASSLRFTPSKLTINAGDSVNWTMLDAREVHPIYIGPASQEPANPFAPPGGGTTAASPNSALNSGPLVQGDTYKVTFAAPGVYQYLCLLHAEAGMVGEVDVLPTGYRAVASDGGVFTFGTSSFLGSQGGSKLNAPIVASASTPTGKGYWMAASDGGVFNFGDAPFLGSMGGTKLNKPIVGMASTPTGKGYWLVASDGGVFNFGDAKFFGSTGAIKLNQPVVGMTGAADGAGYLLVASDGGIFNFGSAKFLGSMGGTKLNQPVVGISGSPSGAGYILVASDGGVFTFGDTTFLGSMGGSRLNKPVVAIMLSADRAGYWLIASDGGIFNFGDAKFFGSTGSIKLNKPIVSMSF